MTAMHGGDFGVKINENYSRLHCKNKISTYYLKVTLFCRSNENHLGQIVQMVISVQSLFASRGLFRK